MEEPRVTKGCTYVRRFLEEDNTEGPIASVEHVLHVRFNPLEDSFMSNDGNTWYNDLRAYAMVEGLGLNGFGSIHVHMETNNKTRVVLYGEYDIFTQRITLESNMFFSSRDFHDAFTKCMAKHIPYANNELGQVDLVILRVVE